MPNLLLAPVLLCLCLLSGQSSSRHMSCCCMQVPGSDLRKYGIITQQEAGLEEREGNPEMGWMTREGGGGGWGAITESLHSRIREGGEECKN